MIKESFFPTLVYAKDVNLDNDKISNDIVKWSHTDKGVEKTNMGGWHSTTDMASKPEYESLVKELIIMQQEIYKEELIERQPRLGNMWANINPKNAYNDWHVHPNCLFSGVYYSKANPNSGPLKISDPRSGTQLVMPVRQNKKLPHDLWREVRVPPITGRIIMFPAWLWHKVEPNLSDDIRISVSFNFIQEGF